MTALDRFSEPVRAWFLEAFGQPTLAQERGWPPIQAGEHTLILSPTGSGKTLAAFLWAIDRLYAELESSAEPAGVRLLYVSPLKALNNDIERNLRAPLSGVREAAARLGRPLPELRVAVRTGDTPGRARLSMLKRPPHILITTPESLYLMLTSSKARDMLRTVRTVIVDEIHTVAGNKRGVHLALSLERLEHLTGERVQRVGLSATQRPLEVVARFLGGQEWREGALAPRPVTIVDAGLSKPLDLEVRTTVADFRALGADSVWPSVEEAVAALIAAHHTTLVFTNGRRLAERIAADLTEKVGQGTIRAHHGSMAAAARLEMEADLKAGRLPALVGTSSLELGIDIGAVDLVVQLQSPKGVARGLQRVGRSGHLVGQTSRGRIFATHREDLVEAAAVAEGMLRGEVEPTEVPENCLDVLAQQLVAAVSVDDWPAEGLYDLVRQSYPYRDLPRAAYEAVLAMLAGKYPREVYRELRPRLDWDRASGRLSALPGSAYLATASGGTIADRGAYGVYLADGHTKIGELDEEFVYERRVGDVITLGNRSWRVERIGDDRVQVADAPSGLPTVPFWRGDTPWRAYELGLAVGRLRREVAAHLDDPGAIAWLRERAALDEQAARSLLAYVREQVQAVGAISSDRTVLVELLRDPLGDTRLVVHSPFGGRVNAAWGLALTSALRERLHTTPECRTNDDGILLRTPDAEQAPPLDLVASLTPAEARERILAELPDSALFGAQFRQNAARALLMPRARRRRRTPFWLQRLRAKDLLAATRQLDSFPIIVETYRDCLRDVLDLEHLLEVLERIQRGEVRVVPIERLTPTPVAASLLRDFQGVYQYEWDAPKAERALRTLACDRGLLQELLSGVALGDLLRPEALSAMEAQLQHTADGRRARTREEMALLLQELGDLTTDELLARAGEGGVEWLAALAAEGRIVECEIPTAAGPVRRWILAEEAETYACAFVCSPRHPPPPSLSQQGVDAAHASLAGRDSPLLCSGREEGGERIPPPASAAAPEGDQARRTLLRRLLMGHGPLSLEEMRARYDLPPEWLAATLTAWAAEHRLVYGRLRPGAEGEAWCDRENLAQAHRRTLALLRREVQPVPLACYVDFLARWQHVHPGHLLPPGSLRRAIQQLRALPAPALLWARDLLPARVQGFRPADLEALCQGGEVIWIAGGQQSAQPAHLRVRLLFRGEGALYLPAGGAREVSEPALRVLACLRSEGACFTADLERATGLRGDDLARALLELVAAGLVTNDSCGALSEVVRFRPQAGGRRPLSSLEAELATRWRGPREWRPGRLHEARRRAARRMAAAPQWVGRWSLVHRLGTWGEEATPEERLDRQARQLLARYGILTRECLRREDLGATWVELYAHLELLEMRGEVRRGYFVQGLSGAQFALPEAVERLRESNARPPDEEGPLVVLNAWDPAWPLGGLLTAGPAAPRRPGTYAVLHRGTPVLFAERWGRALVVPGGIEGALLLDALSACLGAIAGRSGRRRLLVERWNGAPVAGSAGGPLLERLGAYPRPPGMEWPAARQQRL